MCRCGEAEIGATVPTFSTIRSSMYRARAKVRPVLPQSRSEIVIDWPWAKTLGDEPFLLFNDGTEDRILGFSTAELIHILCDSSVIYMDGTFRVVPSLFLQLYTLHAFYKGKMIPLVCFLLPDKRRETYSRMFELLKTHARSMGKTFDPPTFQLDFEVSMLKSIEARFPTATVKGCYFHFAQCLWRKVQELGLSSHYGEPEVKRLIKSCAALGLVPLQRIDDAWLEIDSDSPGPEHPAHEAIEQFKEYFINTWLENDSVFPRTLWNHYRNFGARTTNHIEGWHQGLNRIVRKSHSVYKFTVNIFELITHLKNQEAVFKTQMILLRSGGKPDPLRKKYKVLNDKLVKFVEELDSGEKTLIEYIHQVGFSLCF